MSYQVNTALKKERDKSIQTFHIAADPGGLKCPVCGQWSPLDFDSPEGVRLTCDHCEAVAIMPRVPLAKAIQRRLKEINRA